MSTPVSPKRPTTKPITKPITKVTMKAPAKAPAAAKPATRAATTTTAKSAPVNVPKAAERPAPASPAIKPAKPMKVREELVRDSFTMPQSDFKLIGLLKERSLGAKRAAKKSELLRAGLQALAALDAKALVAALNRLTPIKTGRPKKGH